MKIRDLLQELKSKALGLSIPEEIVGVYLYGSSITEKFREESDIDIAILPLHNTTGEERLVLIAKMESIVSKILKERGIHREVSIADLRGRSIPITLQYKIITEGMLLYEKDAIERSEFENAVKREFFDFMPYLEYLREKKYGYLHSKV
jgi:predicted nucleotidyltransferase